MTGIADDIFSYILHLLFNGKGAQQLPVLNGDGQDKKILENTKTILPAITIVNNGGHEIKFGYGQAKLPIAANGGSYTARWKNPVESKMVINDEGTANTGVIVIS